MAGAGGVGIAQSGRDQHADQRCPILDQSQGYAETRPAAGVVGGAVDRVHHPAQPAFPAFAGFLALEAVVGKGGAQPFGQQRLHRVVRLGQPVLLALQGEGTRSACQPRRRSQPHGEFGGLGGERSGGIEAFIERVHRVSLGAGSEGL